MWLAAVRAGRHYPGFGSRAEHEVTRPLLSCRSTAVSHEIGVSSLPSVPRCVFGLRQAVRQEGNWRGAERAPSEADEARKAAGPASHSGASLAVT